MAPRGDRAGQRVKMGAANRKGGGRGEFGSLQRLPENLSKPLFYNRLGQERLTHTGMLHAYLNRQCGCQSAYSSWYRQGESKLF